MLIEIRAKPNSREEKIELADGGLVIFLKEPAEKGKANRALLNLLKKTFGSARLVSGKTSRRKLVEIPQKSLKEAEQAMGL